MDDSKSVTRREFDDVIRRATELAATESEGGEGRFPGSEGGAEGRLAESELLRIAGEVGLPERHVRRALAEVRSGTVPRAQERGGPMDVVLGPERVRVSRVVPGTPRELAAQIDLFLAGSSLRERVRKRRLEPLDSERTLVELEVDSGTREEAVTFTFAGAGMGAMFGFLSMIGMYDVINALAYAVAPVVAGSITAGAALWSRRIHRRSLGDVQEGVEGILDRLEAGHYHGMAKDSLVTKDE
jgi:hypothetical protein